MGAVWGFLILVLVVVGIWAGWKYVWAPLWAKATASRQARPRQPWDR